MTKRSRFALSLLSAILFVAATPAAAAVVHVNAANVTGVEDGTSANPFSTIPAGLAAAVPGDDVLVAPGIYYGTVELRTGIRLVSQQGPAVTVIDGMGASYAVGLAYEAAPRVSISGFTIRNASQGLFVSNRVTFWAYSLVEVSDCVFRDVSIGVDSFPASDVRLTRTVIHSAGTAVYTIWCSPVRLTNVTIDRVDIALLPYQNGAIFTNTAITNVNTVVYLWGWWGTGSVWGSNNDLYAYTTLASPNRRGGMPWISLTNGISADPLYVNGPLADYRTQTGSPLIDAGIDVGLPYSGAAPDIGSYEHAPQTPLEAAGMLAESYAAVPTSAYKNAGEQRRDALQNKMVALIRKLEKITPDMTVQARLGLYGAALNELENDIWAKADGFYGGNPGNDWITTQEEQAALEPKVAELRSLIQTEIAALQQ